MGVAKSGTEENRGQSQTTNNLTTRRHGLFNEAKEICTMCDAQIGVITFSEAGNAFAFGHPSVDSVIDRYLAKPSSSSASVHSNAVKEFEGKYNEVIGRLEAEKKREEIMDRAREGKPLWEAPIDELGLDELQQYKATLEEMKEKLLTRFSKMITNHVPSDPFQNASVVPHGYGYRGV